MAHTISNSPNPPRRAVFLDRDGVINRRRVGDYVTSIDEFEFLPDIFSVLPEIHRVGALAVLITNQRGVSRGLMSLERLHEIHAWMQQQLYDRTGHRLDAIYFCPHGLHDGCSCRKPLPGMLCDAAADHGIDLWRSWMIGDTESDIAAGRAAGCHTARVDAGGDATAAELQAATLGEVWELLAPRLQAIR